MTTPANGLQDKYLNIGLSKKGVGPLETLSLTASRHDYKAARLGIDYGNELNLQLQAKYHRFTGTLKYADYNAAATTPTTQRDTTKFWAQVDFVW